MILLRTKEPIQSLEEWLNGAVLALMVNKEGLESEKLFIEERVNKTNEYFIDKSFGELEEQSYDILKKITVDLRNFSAIDKGFTCFYRVFYEAEKEVINLLITNRQDTNENHPELTEIKLTQEQLDEITKAICEDFESGELWDETSHYITKNNLFDSDDDWDDFHMLDWAYTTAYEATVYQFIEEKVIELIKEKGFLEQMDSE